MLIQINVDIGYDIGFDSNLGFSLPHGSLGKNVIIFGADMSFSANKMKTTRLNGCVYNFSDYRAFDTSNIIDINKYLMKKHNVNDVWVY